MACACLGKTDHEAKRSREIDAELKIKKKELAQEVKLLLLGAGEAGKSTVLKQMKVIHNDGFTEDDRRRMQPAVYNHIISSIRAIVQAMAKLQITLDDDSLQSDFEWIKQLQPNARWSQETYEATKRLWQDGGVRRCFERANEYQLNDNADYFFDNIDTVAGDGYIPSEQDIIRLRIQTTGIFETKFQVGQMIFHMFDVGGQRSERRKWLLCFSEVTAILFVIAISSYDQCLREDSTTNRLKEALTLFESIWNNKYLKSVSIILLQNKIDVLAEKLRRSDLSKYFSDYTGGSSYTEATKYIQGRFMKIAAAGQTNDEKRVYPHFICAIDTEIVKNVFVDIKNIILNVNLRRYGFV
eukprot:comp18497_c2_seq1/m.19875 comp18497_c2_seq1/g.19875  ORF comp18497_c2_seq1/g.19875 comp18497_c2_seq1/m.19875 type:complete len:355 (-) comp18497_c2_seq1:375-1439(-)